MLTIIAAALIGQGTASLEAKVAAILPKPEEERYLQIPWRTDLMAARKEAQERGKPIFLWIMNGHPLGCT